MNGVLTFSQWAKSTRLDENVRDAKAFLIKRYAERNRLEKVTPEDEQKAVNIEAYHQIRDLLKNNDGYVYAFVKFHFEQRIPVSSSNANNYRTLEKLYDNIKKYAGLLNTLPMTVVEYAKTPMINNTQSFEVLMDQFDKIENRKKHSWIVDKVNGTLRRNIKQLSPEKLDRLYAAAKIIDESDEASGTSKDPETGLPTNTKLGLLAKSNAYQDADEYLRYAEEKANSAVNSDIVSKIKALKELEPEAGIIYSKNGYLAMSVRTEEAQVNLCSIADWCINRRQGYWEQYGGKRGSIQYNIFNFNLPPTDLLHITGTTIYANGSLHTSHNKRDDLIMKSSNPREHFTKLDYPEDLVKALVNHIPIESLIKTVLDDLKVESSDPENILNMIVDAAYQTDMNSIRPDTLDTIVSIVKDRLTAKISKQTVYDIYMKRGVLSVFAAKVLNTLIPNMTNEDRRKFLDRNDQLLNDPVRGLKKIISSVGRSKYPTLTSAIDHEEEIKNIISNGDIVTLSKD